MAARLPSPWLNVSGIRPVMRHAAAQSPQPRHLVFVHVARLLFHRHVERAGLPFDGRDLRVRHQRDERVLAHVHHLGREDAGGTIQRGERLVELRHAPADARLAFHQVNGETGARQCPARPGCRRCPLQSPMRLACSDAPIGCSLLESPGRVYKLSHHALCHVGWERWRSTSFNRLCYQRVYTISV